MILQGIMADSVTVENTNDGLVDSGAEGKVEADADMTNTDFNLTDGLASQLDVAKQALKTWTKRQEEEMVTSYATHAQGVKANTSHVEKLRKETEKQLSIAKQVSKEEQLESKKIKEIQVELQLAQERETLLPERINEYTALTNAEEERVFKERQNIAHEEKKTHGKIRSLNASVQMYSERLGLKFSQTNEDELAFVFTQVDEKFPHEEFSINVHVSDDKKYEVTKCVPQIAKIDDMVHKLNADNDFSSFIRNTRRQFKTIALSERTTYS